MQEGVLPGVMGTFDPAEFAAQCQVPQSQLPDNSQDDSGEAYERSMVTEPVPLQVGFGMRVYRAACRVEYAAREGRRQPKCG